MGDVYHINGLDAWLTRSNPNEDEEYWCPICGCNAEECEQPEYYQDGVYGHEVNSHRSEWIPMSEHMRDAAEDAKYEERHDAQET